MELTPSSWNTRYENGETGWDIGQVSPPLKNYFDQLDDRQLSILIPGSGNSYEAEYLYRKGFQHVYLLDWAMSALHKFHHRVKDYPVHLLIHDDFFKHRKQYDLIIEQTFFCAIHPSLRTAYAKHVFELLKPGGRLVGLLFDDKLNDDHPPFGGNREEYLRYFSPYFHVRHFDKCYNSIEPRAGRELFIHLTKKENPDA